LFTPLSWLLRNKLIVFCYHEVSDSPSEFVQRYDLNVSPSIFEKQMEWVKKNCNTITPHQLLEGNYSTPAALITFDDGMAGYFNNAVPILKKKQIPSIIFLNMAPVEGDIFWSGLVTYLSEYDHGFKQYLAETDTDLLKPPLFLSAKKGVVEEYLSQQKDKTEILNNVRKFYGEFANLGDLQDYAEEPLVYYANHLYNHYNVETLTNKELKEEYEHNEEKILSYPNGLRFFSYPFGRFDESHTLAIKTYGAKAIFQSSNGTNTKTNKKVYNRISLTQDTITTNQFKFFFIVRSLRNFVSSIDFLKNN